jgi:glycosyltransferase involved in cell wall biosynthesis
MPKVSIITRTKDRPLLLERAIESVLSQSFDDWEHLIIDSNLSCYEEFDKLIQKYSQQYQNRLKIVKNIDEIPLDPSMDIGLKNTDGEYLVFHDDDDSWEIDFLHKTVVFLDNNPDFGGVVTDINYYIEEILGDEIKVHQKYISKSLNPMTIFNIFLKRIYHCPISFLFRKKCSDKVGFFNKNLLKYGDREFFLRFLKKYKIATLSEPLANYHARPYNTQVYANSTLASDKYQDNSYWENKVKKELFRHNFDLWVYYHWIEFIRPYLEEKRIKSALKKCAGQKIALYGAGMRAEELLQNHKKEFEKLNIVAVFDQNIQKQGQSFAGNSILPPEKIAEIKPEKVLITVANVSMVKGFIEKLIIENHLDCEIITLN